MVSSPAQLPISTNAFQTEQKQHQDSAGSHYFQNEKQFQTCANEPISDDQLIEWQAGHVHAFHQ
jgi:hypothetical protein